MSKNRTSEKVKARIARKKEATALKVSAIEAAELVEELQLDEKCGGPENATLLAASIACEMMIQKGFANLKGVAGVAEGIKLLGVVKGATPELREMADDFASPYTPENGPDTELMKAVESINRTNNRVFWMGNMLIKRNKYPDTFNRPDHSTFRKD